MFDFAVKGAVVGFNTSKDGSKHFVKIQPTGNIPALNRDERPGLVDIQIAAGSIRGLGMNAPVLVKGKGLVILKDWRSPEGIVKTIQNHRFEAESIEPIKA